MFSSAMTTTTEELRIVFDAKLTPKLGELYRTDLHELGHQAKLSKTMATRVVHNGRGGQVTHSNYLSYLEICWARHLTPVLTPDVIWFTLLNEVTLLVQANPERVRHLFSVTAGKQEIVVPTEDAVILPLDLVTEQLDRLVPGGAAKYLPEFSTSDDTTRFAVRAAFCDAVSPYYDYCMYLCGLPGLIVRGTVDDYERLLNAWLTLPDELFACDGEWRAAVGGALSTVADAMRAAPHDNPCNNFWRGIFGLERCGSGSQTEVTGWFSKLFRVEPDVRFTHNYSTHVARVNYKNISTGRSFALLSGILSSDYADGVLTPRFDKVVYETTE